MRPLILVVVLALAGEAAAETANDRLLEFYGQRKNYRAVRNDVLGWHGTTRNGCVAFLSTALRRIGVAIPQDGIYDGEKVSRLTRPFSLWLQEVAGWRRVESVGALRPGDVVFTENAEYPWHTYVFRGWKDEKRGIAWVIDNQGWRHARDVFGSSDGNFTPFAYALRAPPDGSVDQ